MIPYSVGPKETTQAVRHHPVTLSSRLLAKAYSWKVYIPSGVRILALFFDEEMH